MRAVVERVSRASVTVDGQVVGAIAEPGLLVFVGVTHDDTPAKAAKLAAKLWGLRLLEGEKSCSDTAAPLLPPASRGLAFGEVRKGLPSAVKPIGFDGSATTLPSSRLAYSVRSCLITSNHTANTTASAAFIIGWLPATDAGQLASAMVPPSCVSGSVSRAPPALPPRTGGCGAGW